MTRFSLYFAKIVWKAASSNFANAASNSSNAIYSIQNVAGVSLNSTWAKVEYPLLHGRDIIYGIVFQNGSTHIMP